MPKDHDQSLIHASGESSYRTPPALFAALDREFDFEVDAAADRETALCDWWYGPEAPYGFQDALQVGWATDIGRSHFCNPPYAKKMIKQLTDAGRPAEEVNAFRIEKWAEKCALEGRHLTVVGLFPFAPQTQWFRKYVLVPPLPSIGARSPYVRADRIRIFPYRLKFLLPNGDECANVAGVNHCIIEWRPDPGWQEPWAPTIRWWDYKATA